MRSFSLTILVVLIFTSLIRDCFNSPSQVLQYDTCLRWVKNHDSHDGVRLSRTAMLVSGAGCARKDIFRRFSVGEAIDLLRDEYVLFVGDSVTTYEYLSLANFLSFGDSSLSWNSTTHGYPHVLAEQYWKLGESNPWDVYYAKTNERFAGNEICDCYRDVACHPNCKPQTFFGNRHFVLPQSLGKHRPTASVIFAGGSKLKPRWHNVNWFNFSCDGDRMCSQRPPDVALDGIEGNSDILKSIAETFKPSILVNGLDNHWPSRAARLTCDTIQAISDYPGVFLISRSNSLQKSQYTESVATETAYLSRCRESYSRSDNVKFQSIHDVRLIIDKLIEAPIGLHLDDIFVDEMHFRPWVYFELTQLLLNEIYAIKSERPFGLGRLLFDA
jgi:hypothetical protein